MKKGRLNGVIPPLLTPLDSNGKLDVPGLERLINHCIYGGVDGIFVLGSCGEGSVVDTETQRLVVQEALRIVDARVPVLVGLLETSADRVIEQMRTLPAEGVDGYVVTVPYYLQVWGPDQIFEHYRQIAQATDTDIILYNIPSFTSGYEINMDMVERLLTIPNVVAVKDSTDSWLLLQRKIFRRRDLDFSLFCGNEDMIAASGVFGVDGCVPCMANAYPEFLVELFSAAKAGKLEKALACEEVLQELKTVFSAAGSWIAACKYLCARKGLMQEYTAISGAALTEEQKQKMEDILAAVDPKIQAMLT